MASPAPPVAPGFRDRHPLTVQLTRYVVAGGVGTLTNALVYLLLRNWWDLLPANLAALVVSTLVSTEVNRRFTFSGAEVHRWRVHVQTAGMVAFYAVYSSAVLLALTVVVDRPTPLLESATVAAASVLGGAGRFLLLRYWVLDRDSDGPSLADRLHAHWHGRRRWTTASAVAFVAGALLVVTTAACGLVGY
ncbi:GtrA family protein [Pseudonocardia sp.]|uniref:GtrA family protein n=1 Tax=Pseudonocardia sp. TaxID=60912 RepID=UPI002637ACCD|nr:GtrA family protein [Pseudonocardia sp.]